ncbi:hypothetical protein LXL04_004133, partial [Taraxacum kok-saghyz]
MYPFNLTKSSLPLELISIARLSKLRFQGRLLISSSRRKRGCRIRITGELLSFLSEIPCVHLIVVVGGLDELMPSLPSATGVKVVSFSKLITQGSSNHHPFHPPKP